MGTAEIIFSALPDGRITVVAYADTLGQLCLCLDNPQADFSSPWLSGAG